MEQCGDLPTERDLKTEMYLRACKTHISIQCLLLLGGVQSVLNCFLFFKLVSGFEFVGTTATRQLGMVL